MADCHAHAHAHAGPFRAAGSPRTDAARRRPRLGRAGLRSLNWLRICHLRIRIRPSPNGSGQGGLKVAAWSSVLHIVLFSLLVALYPVSRLWTACTACFRVFRVERSTRRRVPPGDTEEPEGFRVRGSGHVKSRVHPRLHARHRPGEPRGSGLPPAACRAKACGL